MSSQRIPTKTLTVVGDLMRYWRGERGLSQLELSLESGISQRHLSFVESGRSTASRNLLLTLSDALNIPLRERNELFLAAGYAPLYREPAFDDGTMTLVSRALEQMLKNHEPHPALLIDRYWNVVRPNSAATTLFRSLIDLDSFPKPRNLLELAFDPAGLRAAMEDWETIAAAILQRVRREAVGQVIDARLQALLDKIKQFPGVAKLPVCTDPESPIIPITFRRGKERLSYFSLVTTVGTPQTITAQELRLECMFPMEAASASH